ncbi:MULTISPECIES: DUF6227 family protein [unclassified Streptomyces]|uniref:DUF6227 family protein n=1 Tax=unclassified Streptomyces TaxID=2593676 RepID=UPI0037F97CBB
MPNQSGGEPERGPGGESAQEQLAGLLGRALNSFDLPDELVERLDSALAHTTSLHSSLHTSATGPAGHRLSRETYRHCYLLLDGSTVTLWELAHHDGRAYAHEVYAAEEDARIAAARLHRGALSPESAPVAEEFGRAGGESGPSDAFGALDAVEDFAGCWEAGFGPDALLEPDGAALGRDAGSDLALLAALSAAPLPRRYAPDDSADHARRLLRRAENPDRPGEGTARLLRSAHAHQITQAFGSHCRTAGRDAGFVLYEHAFLLLDGGELSLWEVEHTATPDGRHMCEVYASEQAARTAMERRARVG